MVNTVLDATTKQLGTTFGTNYHYYKENVEQKLVKPCFTVDVLNPLSRSISPILYMRTVPLVLHYFTDEFVNPKADIYAKAEQILEALEYLPVGDTLLRAENMSYHLVDDVLEVFLTYRFRTKKVQDAEIFMDESNIQVSSKS